MNESEARDHLSRFKRAVFELHEAHMAFLTATHAVHQRDQIFSPVDPVALRDLYDLHDRVLALAKAMRAERENVDTAAMREVLSPEDVTHLEEHFDLSRFLDDALQASGESHAINIGTAGQFGLETDPSGRRADNLIEQTFGLKPRLRLSRDRKGREEDRRIGLWKAAPDMIEHFDTYGDKPRAYHRAAIRNEARRDLMDEIKKERRNVGVRYVPANVERSSAPLPEGRDEIQDRSGIPADELLIAAVVAREREEIVREFRAALPEDQLALLDLWIQDVSPTAALRKLGLRRSVETALRNRLKRLNRRLQENG